MVDNRVYGNPRELTIVVVALAVDILRSFRVGRFVVFFGIWTVLAQVDFSQSMREFLIMCTRIMGTS